MVEALMTTGTFPKQAVINHGIRLQTVKNMLLSESVGSVIDLGCGDGKFIETLQPETTIERITGIDQDKGRLEQARSSLSMVDGFEKVELAQGSFLDLDASHAGHDAAVMVETIEHVEEERVPIIERGVFDILKPRIVIVTTPDATNRLAEEKMQQRGHMFEWDIPEFQAWADGVSDTYPYDNQIVQLGGPTFIRGTQLAIFRKT